MAERFILIAVDTNVLLDEEVGDYDVLDALATIRKKIPQSRFVVTPTVLQELAYAAAWDEDPEKRLSATKATENLRERGYEPLNLIPAGHGIVEEFGLKMRIQGILPFEEKNDGFIIMEAALIGVSLLLSSDSHMLDAQESGLREFLTNCSVAGDKLIIATPRYIVNKFGLR